LSIREPTHDAAGDHPGTAVRLISDDDASYIAGLFGPSLKREVRLELFASETNCLYCGQTRQLLEELVSLTSLLRLDVRDLERERDRADELHVEQAPTTVVHANNGTRFYFLGLPSGHQLRAVAEDIVDASEGSTGMSEFARLVVDSVQRPMTVDVFVTPMDPYSPIVVRAAHRLAMENPNIRARMVEIMEFPDMALKYNVIGVPKIVIDEKIVFDGALAEEALAELLQAAAR
jgi:glutaredoxin-like protein